MNVLLHRLTEDNSYTNDAVFNLIWLSESLNEVSFAVTICVDVDSERNEP